MPPFPDIPRAARLPGPDGLDWQRRAALPKTPQPPRPVTDVRQLTRAPYDFLEVSGTPRGKKQPTGEQLGDDDTTAAAEATRAALAGRIAQGGSGAGGAGADLAGRIAAGARSGAYAGASDQPRQETHVMAFADYINGGQFGVITGPQITYPCSVVDVTFTSTDGSYDHVQWNLYLIPAPLNGVTANIDGTPLIDAHSHADPATGWRQPDHDFGQETLYGPTTAQRPYRAQQFGRQIDGYGEYLALVLSMRPGWIGPNLITAVCTVTIREHAAPMTYAAELDAGSSTTYAAPRAAPRPTLRAAAAARAVAAPKAAPAPKPAVISYDPAMMEMYRGGGMSPQMVDIYVDAGALPPAYHSKTERSS